MPSRRNRIGLRKLVLAIGLAALLPAFAQPVGAEVRVSGQADALIVETREASVEEILAALRASFNLHYRTSDALNRVVTGTYTGSLQRVVARLLEGQNYVLQSSAGGGRLIVIGPGAAGSSVSASRHQVVADAEQRQLPTKAPSPAVPERNASPPVGQPIAPPLLNADSATLAVGQPIAPPLPTADSATLVVPSASPSSLTAPVPPSTQSDITPPNAVNAVAVPGLVPPLPESSPQLRPPGFPG